MNITILNKRDNIYQNKRSNKKIQQFQKLLNELRNIELSTDIVKAINRDIDSLNSVSKINSVFFKQLKKRQTKILKRIEKEYKLVAINHYRNIWLAVGVGVIGVPVGIVVGMIIGNMAFIGMGMPVGFGFGIVIGTLLDQKAKENGKQLNVEIKY